jgi:hypothetical protein
MRCAWLVVVLAVGVAHADDNKQQAVALFEEGQKEMKAGNYPKACEALKKSLDLFSDSGTKGSLAKCYTQLGKVASAWKLWKDLADTAPKNLRADASLNASKLEPRLPTYTYHLGPGAPRVAVTIDKVIVEAPLEVPVPIDPGNYMFEANADGFQGWKHPFTAVEGKNEDIVIPALTPVEKVVDHTSMPKPPPPPPPAKSSKKKIGFVLIGVGGALAITGGVFGILASGRYNDAKDICGGSVDNCDPSRVSEAQDKVDSARTAGNLSTVSFIAGAVAIGAGVFFVVTAPKQHRMELAVVPNESGAGVVLSGGF